MATTATIDDFVLAFGEQEALELTNLDNPDATIIDGTKLQFALDVADNLIGAYYARAGSIGKVIINKSRLLFNLRVARKLLDLYKDRPQVKEDYEQVIAILEFAIEQGEIAGVSTEDLGDITTASTAPIMSIAQQRVFTRDNLANFRNDRLQYT